MRLRDIYSLFEMRDAAMARARMCRARGFLGVDIDVQIARRSNRMALRLLRRGAP